MSPTFKTAVAVISCFLVALTIVLPITIFHVTEKANQEIEQYRDEEIHRVKQSLKDYVDIAYAIIDTNYKNAMDKAYLEKYYGRRLKNIIEIAEQILIEKAKAVDNKKLILSEAQAQAAAEISRLRYDNGTGYVWINDTTEPYPKMIMHPITSELDGQILDASKYNHALPMGKEQNLYQAIVELCQTHGKGFINYLGSKTTKDGLIPEVPMLAYVRLFPDWNWIVGTTIYIDDAINDAVEKSKNDIRRMKYHNGIGEFWITNTNPNLQMVVYPTNPLLEGQNLTGPLKKRYESFVEICETQNGSGFHQFLDKNPARDGMTELEIPKWSYVSLHKPLAWIVGTDIYTNNIDEAVAQKRANMKEEIFSLIVKLMIVSLLIIFLIIGLSFIVVYYFPYLQLVIKQQPITHLNGNNMTEKPTSPSVPNQTVLSIDECIKMVQEISKTLITEYSKLLAIVHQVPQKPVFQPETEDNGLVNGLLDEATSEEQNIADKIKHLTAQTQKTIKEVKKRVEANQATNQPPSEPTNTVEIARFNNNTIMNNLNKMVGH